MTAVWRARGVAAVGLAAGLAIFGFATGQLRNAGGDVLVVVVLVAMLASVPLGSARQRLAAVAAISVGAEALQGLGWVGPESHWLWHLTLGSTFDPVDLVAYAAGLVVAGLAERWWRPAAARQTAPTRGSPPD